MGSRRTVTRSLSANGRSINGGDVDGSSRAGACSYLSNVRPENRSTLCSVIAQLTEETQPSFEATLKSKAVSENSNVKFSCVVAGYPVPQVTWYKDDMQLDRYCGLPKYEIFRNGQNHSLHIYNCTVEDAAIYQASASNTKGIVSCSGVLEVGEMNEFKIHQRYFAKMKQKADQRCREAEGKENLEPLRTISPERTQRKRRSTMEAFLSTPSSTEDEGNDENLQEVPGETETGLQEAGTEEVEEKPVPVTDGPVSAVTSGCDVSENDLRRGAYMHDSAHPPKTPVNKKIKISNWEKVAKADTVGERASEERRTKEEIPVSSALSCTESDEVMEVNNITSSSVVDSYVHAHTRKHQKSTTNEEKFVTRPSSDNNECVRPYQKEQLTAFPAVPPSAPPSTSQTVSEGGGKQAAKHGKKAGRKDTGGKPDTLLTPTQPRAPERLRTLRDDATKTEHVTLMDVDNESKTSTGESLAHRDLESVDTLYESWTALHQPPCEQAGDQLSEEEIRQRNQSGSRPALQSEAQTMSNRNEAPASLEPPHDHCAVAELPPQKTALESETTTVDTQTLSLNTALQLSMDKMTQATLHHSRGSDESHSVLFTGPQKSPLESPGAGEKTQGYKVSPAALQSQVETAIKSVDGTEIQVDEKVESNEEGKLLLQDDKMVLNEKIDEMETETAAPGIVMQNKEKETPQNKPVSKTVDESGSEIQHVKPEKCEQSTPYLENNPQNTHSLPQVIDFGEIPKPASEVISIAEVLRAQFKALDSTIANSAPVQAEFVPEDTSEEVRDGDRTGKEDTKESVPDRKMENTPTNMKATLMEIYHQVNREPRTECSSTSPVQALQKPLVIPPISVTTTETTQLHGSAKTSNDGFMDTGQKTKASSQVPLTDCPIVSPTRSEDTKHIFPALTSNDELTVSQRSGTPIKASGQETNTPVLEYANKATEKDLELILKIAPDIKLSSKTESGISETDLGHCNTLQSARKSPTDRAFRSTDPQENQHVQQDRPKAEELSTHPILEARPLLKERTCVSPIPSATPQELASGARRKILPPHSQPEETTEATPPVDNRSQKKDVSTQSSKLSTGPATLSTSQGLSHRSVLLQPAAEQTSPVERRSPLSGRRKTALESPAPSQQSSENVVPVKTEEKTAEKNKHNPFKAPQVIRKIRSETFADASGHMKLWCQFFNVLSDSTIKWHKNDEEIVQIRRNAGEETQVNLAIVQASSKDSGVYRCSITNEYGADSTDLLLSAEILAAMSLREDLGVGEEIEMTPLIFGKGVADSGVWGNKLFGRIMMQESRIGDGCCHKVWRAKVIYGLEPVFESGNTCIIKVRNPIAYGGKEESCLIDRNLETVKQECKIQNLAREYCKIFSAEARAIENFGPCLDVVPVYMMYRPANTVPYATVEADLTGVYQKYSFLDHTGRLDMRTGSGAEQKCCALQHWIFQWTNGNLLLTRLEGVDTKITNVGISVKSTGHQGLSVEGTPKVFEQFVSQHQCNYFCGLLSLRSLKVMDSLLAPTKTKGSRSPLLQRKTAAGSSSPQTGRKAAGSPRLPRKSEQEGRKTPTRQKASEAPKTMPED
ncbi:alpha-protein kinase 3-like isoform X1 [Channa argus]|uniref:alpha-protein kinase 3-like isoform X1 n=1 Tax=Channa argus TaxID=215402 RepID=UPI00294819B6|nr:hypothetical protein Q8A73_002612 [Channa argus]